MPKPALLVSDLDGTLTTSQVAVTEATLRTLRELGERKVVRAVATGRSLHTARKLLTPDFPIDYLIFSTGAGVLNWKTGQLLVSHSLERPVVDKVAQLLQQLEYDFMLHAPAPENHRFHYHRTQAPHADFLRRLERHSAFATELGKLRPASASQFLAVCELSESLELGGHLQNHAGPLHVCRATSPIDGKSIWLEILSPNASKSLGAAWIAEQLGIERDRTFAVGNDYNDLDLLAWAGAASVVENSPVELKEQFTVAPANDLEGFTAAVRDWMDRLPD
jgi:HAD superfamily hydrolase (TIGR01484 family)